MQRSRAYKYITIEYKPLLLLIRQSDLHSAYQNGLTMQRISTLILAMTFSSLSLSAQITLGPDWLMEAGFSMTLLTDASYNDPQGNIAKAGANQMWEFTQDLDANDTTMVMARMASMGTSFDSFPNADLVFTTEQEAGFVTATSEVYLQRSGNNLNVIGIADADPAAILPAFRLSDPLLFQSTPITFQSTTSDQTRLRLTFPPEILTLLTGDSTYTNFIDSLGVSIGQDVDTDVDGWGTINLNGESYNALRLRSVTEAFQDIEVKVPFLGWVPITQQIPGIDSTIDFNNQRTEAYSWVVADYPYPIMQVTVDSNGNSESATYRTDASLNTKEQLPQVGITAFAQNNTLSVSLASEDYNALGQVKVFGSNGALLDLQSVQLREDQVEFNTSGWPTGIQLVTAWLDGRLVGTKKVLVQ